MCRSASDLHRLCLDPHVCPAPFSSVTYVQCVLIPEVNIIGGAIWQRNVNVAALLPRWEVALAMHAEGEHCLVFLEDEGIAVPLHSPCPGSQDCRRYLLHTEKRQKQTGHSWMSCQVICTNYPYSAEEAPRYYGFALYNSSRVLRMRRSESYGVIQVAAGSRSYSWADFSWQRCKAAALLLLIGLVQQGNSFKVPHGSPDARQGPR